MMAACPNCRSQVYDDQMFCRTCGFRLEPGFQISTQSLGLPSAGRLRVSAAANAHAGAGSCAGWRNYLLPIAGFVLALCFGGFTAAFFTHEPLPNLVIDNILVPQRAERSYMGVYLINDGETVGPVIDRLIESSPAEQASLHSGDRLLAINGQDVATTGDIVAKLSTIAPGSTIQVKVQRHDEEFYLSLTTVRRSELNIQSFCTHEGFLGVGALEPTSELRIGKQESADDESDVEVEGVRVGMVVEDSAAEHAGLQEDDVILAIDDNAIHTPEELSRAVRATTPSQQININVLRDGEIIRLGAIIGSRP